MSASWNRSLHHSVKVFPISLSPSCCKVDNEVSQPLCGQPVVITMFMYALSCLMASCDVMFFVDRSVPTDGRCYL